MDNFFPSQDYTMPVTSNYMKFQEGENTFRVLSSAIVGYEYWNTDNKPVRSPEAFDEIPQDIRKDKDGNYKISHFWAFIVWNYESRKIQVLELTQKSIMGAIQALVKNPKWGNPKGYDITITRQGTGLDSEYTTMPNPHSPLAEDIKNKFEKAKINLEALYKGGDPFEQK